MQSREDFTAQEQILSVDQYASLIRSDLLDISSVSFIPKQDLEVNGRLFRNFESLKTLGKIPLYNDWDSVYDSFDLMIIENKVCRLINPNFLHPLEECLS